MFTVRDEITKYLINERCVKDANSIKNLSYLTVLKMYQKKAKETKNENI